MIAFLAKNSVAGASASRPRCWPIEWRVRATAILLTGLSAIFAAGSPGRDKGQAGPGGAAKVR